MILTHNDGDCVGDIPDLFNTNLWGKTGLEFATFSGLLKVKKQKLIQHDSSVM